MARNWLSVRTCPRPAPSTAHLGVDQTDGGHAGSGREGKANYAKAGTVPESILSPMPLTRPGLRGSGCSRASRNIVADRPGPVIVLVRHGTPQWCWGISEASRLMRLDY
ncbi:hypothetical protein MAE02_49220 [Microvirga aerophila]|uniref:Uncharacterized protein n=1 Tax=Microvirga aerophila TaxID=670291 RepID=A0A512BZ36_9HYPH|nr:hypothetical protein MAE02_49220 [Microvirga aerophila]